MVPEGLATLVAFLLFVAPGLLFEILRERRRPRRDESSFREASRVALASVIFSGISICLLAAGRLLHPKTFPDPRQWLALGGTYAGTHLTMVFGATIAEVVMSLLLAWGAHGLVVYRGRGRISRVDPDASGWYMVFRRDVPPDGYPMARIRMADGTEYMGRVAHYTVDDRVGAREIVLSTPVHIRRPDDEKLLPLPWQRVVVAEPGVISVWVTYF